MEKIREVKLESETIFDGKIVKLTKDKVRCPNGRETTREVIKHCGASCVVAVHNDKIIMEKQYRYPFDEVMIEIPAGKLDKGEDVLECARRELEEETGYYANKLTYMGEFYPTVAYSNEVIHMFIAEDLVKTKTNWDIDENIIIYEDSIEHLLKQIEENEIKDGKTIAALLKYDLIKNKREY